MSKMEQELAIALLRVDMVLRKVVKLSLGIYTLSLLSYSCPKVVPAFESTLS